MSAVTIRFADSAKDAARILEVYAPYIETTPITFEVDVPSEAEFEARVRGIAAEFPYLLLEIDGEPAGYAYAHKQAERAAFGWNAELSIYLAQKWAHRGLGKPMYALLMDLLRMQGYVNFYAVITGSNAGSIAMHEQMGFVRIGLHEKTGFKFGQWHDTVWLCRRVAGDGAPGRIVPVSQMDGETVHARMAKTEGEIRRILGR